MRPEGAYQENSRPLDRLEPVTPVVLACQHISWIYDNMSESSTCAGSKNYWYQSRKLDLVHSPGTRLLQFLSFVRFHRYCTEIIIIIKV